MVFVPGNFYMEQLYQIRLKIAIPSLHSKNKLKATSQHPNLSNFLIMYIYRNIFLPIQFPSYFRIFSCQISIISKLLSNLLTKPFSFYYCANCILQSCFNKMYYCIIFGAIGLQWAHGLPKKIRQQGCIYTHYVYYIQIKQYICIYIYTV